MPQPKVTVLIDTYNHERFVERAITSAIEQDFPANDVEILVVDDGSTDATPAIVKRFAPRVTYLRKENGGQASAFNFGIPQARGEIVAFLDGDDWWQRNKLSVVVETFEKNPQAGVVGHGIFEIDSRDAESGSALSPEQPGYFDLRSDAGAQRFRNFMCFLGTSRVAIRRSLLEKVLPIPEALVVEADEFMSAVAIAHGGAYLLAEPLTYYRLHDQNQYQFRDGRCDHACRQENERARRTRRRVAGAACSGRSFGERCEYHRRADSHRRGANEIDPRWAACPGRRIASSAAIFDWLTENHVRLSRVERIIAGDGALRAAAVVLSAARLVLEAKSTAVSQRDRRTCACSADSRCPHRASRKRMIRPCLA